MDHPAVYSWNHLPDVDTGLAPIKLFAGLAFDGFNFLKMIQVFGHVLDPTLQDGKTLPKWVPQT
jgi:hypothetical protein